MHARQNDRVSFTRPSRLCAPHANRLLAAAAAAAAAVAALLLERRNSVEVGLLTRLHCLHLCFQLVNARLGGVTVLGSANYADNCLLRLLLKNCAYLEGVCLLQPILEHLDWVDWWLGWVDW